MNPRVIVVISEGIVSEIQVSSKLKDQGLQVVIKDMDVSDIDEHTSIARDENGELAAWSLWDAPDFSDLLDETYEHINWLIP